ncbi:MAG: hypothetical protein NDJ89_17730 [Oligoflexia bacterium]|nr:hypothetical protein [Oligoflexia bacterium]
MGHGAFFRSRRALGLAASFAFAVPLTAQGEFNEPRWHGFATIGAVKNSADTPYLRVADEHLNLNLDSVVGLNVTAPLGEHWEAVVQLIAEGSTDFFAAEADWVLLRYFPDNHWSFDLGKQRAPVWLLSDRLDVGFVRPWIRTREEMYFNRIPSTYLGPSVTYSFGSAQWDGWGQAYLGAITLNNERPFNSERDFISEIKGANFGIGTQRVRFRLSFVDAHVESHTLVKSAGGMGGPSAVSERDFVTPDSRYRFYSAGVSVDTKGWVSYAEYGKMTSDGVFIPSRLSAYLMAGRRFGDFLFHYTYGWFNGDPSLINQGSQHSHLLGAKLMLASSVDAKLEWQRTIVTSGTGKFLEAPGSEPITLWSAAVDFVF